MDKRKEYELIIGLEGEETERIELDHLYRSRSSAVKEAEAIVHNWCVEQDNYPEKDVHWNVVEREATHGQI